ncbi:MAG: sporulation protein [Thioalkalivibrio sp.]|nr:MAG: sporulation protein [Thioalkalivibrio sp.]
MSLPPDCLAELKLQQAPFDSVPSEDFIYTDSLIEDTVAAAVQAIDMSGAMLLITGETGSGRSMQLMRLLGSLPENFELIAFRARLNTRFEAVDFTIRSHLQAGGHDDPDRALSDLMSERIRAGSDPVIAVDDAHLLGMDIINILLRMRAEILDAEGRAPRLVLVGDQVLLRRRLQLRPSDENQIARFTLRPFSLEQTAAYLTHRLRAAGMADPGEILTEDAIADLQAASRGLPGPLNEQANAWLERLCRARRGEEEESEPEPEPLRDDRMAAFARGMPPLGVTGDPPDEPPEDLTPIGRRESSQQAGEPEQAPAPDEDWDPYTGRMQKRASEPDGDKVPFWSRSWFVPVVAAVVALLILAPFARHLLERPEPPPTTTVQLPLPVAPEEAPEPAPEAAWPDDQDVVELPFDDRVPAEIPPGEPPAAETPGAPPAPETAPETAPEPVPEPAPEPPPPPEPEPEPAPEPAPPPPEPEPEPPAEPAPPATEPVDLAADRAWLERQSGDNFTIQLAAAPDLDGARRFVEQHQLTGIRYIPTRLNGRDFVVALAGSFASRPAAEQALENLPAGVRDGQPWIRSLGSVQDIQR